ncbi:MAG: PhzF family phenazine biosynthesis protein [Gemmatirosa sp.]|nr:PhzF family phenazine biosynthesis protein [Gemmatirosa sp.]
MRTYRFATADVFTDRQFGGNQLAVILDARGLTDDEMLAITREFNFSESTFVLPPERGGARRVRIFTPGGEVPFAGHPTIGTAHVLFALGELRTSAAEASIVLEENVGDVPVRVRLPNAGTAELGGIEPSFAQLSVAQLPEERPTIDVPALADVLSLDAADFVGGEWAPVAASCGLPFVIAPLRTRDAVSRARVRLDAWEQRFPADAWTREIMVVAMDAGAPGFDARARVFVPGLSVPEDPATGSCNAALGGYLARRTPRLDGTLRWAVEQGVEMGRPSRLEIEVDKQAGAITAVRVGGASVVVSRGELTLR